MQVALRRAVSAWNPFAGCVGDRRLEFEWLEDALNTLGTAKAAAEPVESLAVEAVGAKVAIALVGQLRALHADVVLQTLQEELIRPLKADVFLMASTDESWVEELRSVGRGTGHLGDFEVLSTNEIIRRLQPVEVQFYNSTDFPDRYDWVIRARPDVTFVGRPVRLPLSSEQLRTAPAMVFGQAYYHGCLLCDQFFLATRNAFEALFGLEEAFRRCEELLKEPPESCWCCHGECHPKVLCGGGRAMGGFDTECTILRRLGEKRRPAIGPAFGSEPRCSVYGICCEASKGPDQPAFWMPLRGNRASGGCLYNSDVLQHPPSCDGAHPETQRLCACRTPLMAATAEKAPEKAKMVVPKVTKTEVQQVSMTAEAAGWKPGVPMQVWSVAAWLIAPLGGLLLAATARYPWSSVETYEATSATLLRAHFTLAEGCFRVRTVPERNSRQVSPLRVPWVPLQDLVEGPPALARFRRTGDDCALGVWLGGWIAQSLGLYVWRRALTRSWRPVLVLRSSGYLYLCSSAIAILALTRYSAVCRHRLKILVSEFVLGISAGDVVLWPQDLSLQMATSAYLMLFSALVNFLLGIYQITTEFYPLTSAPAVGKVQSEVRRISNPRLIEKPAEELESPGEQEETEKEREDREFFLKALEVTKAQIKSHNRRVAGTVIMAMLAFVILLCGVAFFFGRCSTEMRKAKESAKDLVVGAGNATASTVASASRSTAGAARHARHGLRQLREGARQSAQELAEAVRSPDWRQVLWKIMLLPGAAMKTFTVIRRLREGDTDKTVKQSVEDKPKFRWPWQKPEELKKEADPWWKRLLPKKERDEKKLKTSFEGVDLSGSSLLVVHEGTLFSPDFLQFFSQLELVMEEDATVWCVGAWNDAGLAPYVADRTALLRTDWHPAKHTRRTRQDYPAVVLVDAQLSAEVPEFELNFKGKFNFEEHSPSLGSCLFAANLAQPPRCHASHQRLARLCPCRATPNVAKSGGPPAHPPSDRAIYRDLLPLGLVDVTLPSQRCGASFGNRLAADCAEPCGVATAPSTAKALTMSVEGGPRPLPSVAQGLGDPVDLAVEEPQLASTMRRSSPTRHWKTEGAKAVVARRSPHSFGPRTRRGEHSPHTPHAIPESR
eukprot:g12087.t1